MFLHIFGHIYTNHRLFTSKDSFCQSLGKFCLTNTCRSKEKERTNGTIRIFKSHSSSFHCLRNSFHCLILSDHTFMEFFFQTSKTFGFSFCQSLKRNLCPVRNRLCNSSFIYNKFFPLISALSLNPNFLHFGFHFILAYLRFFCAFNIRSLNCLLLLLTKFIQFQFIFFHFRC